MNLFQVFKKKYRHIRNLLKPHPIFSIVDNYKLSKIKKDTKKSGFIYLKPKGWIHSIRIRKNYTDKEVVYYVLQDQFHLPPKLSKVPINPIILDLGSNIGLTIAHMKLVYPNAKIIGYEMNKENYVLALKNTKFYKDVIVFNKAIWINVPMVSYKVHQIYDSYSIVNNKVDRDESIEVS